jgi:hypothetical protein
MRPRDGGPHAERRALLRDWMRLRCCRTGLRTPWNGDSAAGDRVRSAKQRRRMAAKARQRVYREMRERMNGPHDSLFDELCAVTAYSMRRQLITPPFAERPQWEPPR